MTRLHTLGAIIVVFGIGIAALERINTLAHPPFRYIGISMVGLIMTVLILGLIMHGSDPRAPRGPQY